MGKNGASCPNLFWKLQRVSKLIVALYTKFFDFWRALQPQKFFKTYQSSDNVCSSCRDESKTPSNFTIGFVYQKLASKNMKFWGEKSNNFQHMIFFYLKFTSLIFNFIFFSSINFYLKLLLKLTKNCKKFLK